MTADDNDGRGWAIVLALNDPLIKGRLVLGVFADHGLAGRVSREYVEAMTTPDHTPVVERHWIKTLNAITGVTGEPM